MEPIEPATRSDFGNLASVETGIVGARLSAVTYHYLPPVWGPEFAGGGSGADCDISAVVLDLGGRGRRTITWATIKDDMQGLAILADGTVYSGVGDETLDAGDREAWRDSVGDVITSVGAAWQFSGKGLPESAWAVRLDFSARSVVVALGTANPSLDYMPNELVVVFDGELARGYRPRHVNESAWGRRVASSRTRGA
jgi:hypothetical protein